MLEKLLADAKQSRFWGHLELDFQDGEIVVIRRSETFKIKREGDKRDERNTYRQK